MKTDQERTFDDEFVIHGKTASSAIVPKRLGHRIGRMRPPGNFLAPAISTHFHAGYILIDIFAFLGCKSTITTASGEKHQSDNYCSDQGRKSCSTESFDKFLWEYQRPAHSACQ
jgi:hypothetical protein